MNYPRVSIIILNWNGWKDTIECLESLYRINYPNYDVIVVDNASQDDSIEKIKEYCEGKIEVNSKFFKYSKENKPIRVFEITEDDAKEGKFNYPLYEKYDVDRRMILIKNKDNYGFSGGNNIGIKFALGVLNPDYVLLLNNDTVVDKEFLKELVRIGEKRYEIGVLNPIIYYYDYPEKIQFAGERINWFFFKKSTLFNNEKGITNDVLESENACGAAMLIRREVIHKVGLLSLEYFMLSEDTDYSVRVSKAGFKIGCIPDSKIWHKVSASLTKVSPIKVRLSVRNMFILRYKYLNIYIEKVKANKT